MRSAPPERAGSEPGNPGPPVPSDDADRRRRLIVVVLITTIAAILGFNLVALKVAIKASDPATAQALSMVVAVASMFVVAELTGEPRRLERRWWPAAMAMAGTLTVFSTLGIAFGVERVDAGVAALMISTMPIISLLLDRVLLHQRHSLHGYIGALIGFLGIGIMALAEQRTGGGTQLLGVVYLLLGALGWALGLLLMKSLAGDAPPSTLLAWTFALGTPVLLVVGVVTNGLRVEWSPLVVLAILYAGVLAKGASFLLQIAAVRLGTPVQASLTAFLMPVFGTLAGVLLLDEAIRTVQIVAALPVLGGVGLVLRSTVVESRR